MQALSGTNEPGSEAMLWPVRRPQQNNPSCLYEERVTPNGRLEKRTLAGLKSRSAAVSALLTVPPYFAAFPPGITNSTTTL